MATQEPRTFSVKLKQVMACPKRSFLAGHYRADGSCLCAPGAPGGAMTLSPYPRVDGTEYAPGRPKESPFRATADRERAAEGR